MLFYSLLQKSSFDNNIFLFKQDIVQFQLFKNFLRLVNIAKAQLNELLFNLYSFNEVRIFCIQLTDLLNRNIILLISRDKLIL